MFTLYKTILAWIQDNKNFALATVIKTWGAAPRTVGAKMAVNQDGEIVGSVSGGCVEGAVVSACLEILESGKPRMLHFDVADETALNVGLSCGGELDVFVWLPSSEFLEAFDQAYSSEQALTQIMVISGDHIGEEILIDQQGKRIGGNSVEHILESLAIPYNQPQTADLSSGEQIFIDVNNPPPKLMIVGGVHTAVALTRIAKACGYTVILIDPRRQFGTKVRFPEADQIINLWPDAAFEQAPPNSNTAVAFLTHDPKIDDPGLIAALQSEAFYVGALGSRKTQETRKQRLIESGIPKKLLSNIHGPIGLPLGGREPEEIAISIMAEIIQKRNQK